MMKTTEIEKRTMIAVVIDENRNEENHLTALQNAELLS